MNQSQIESKSWELIEGYLSSSPPERWHLFAARSNYDSNSRALSWLINNPELDRATALMIYWNLGAAWFSQYANEHEADDAGGYRFLKLIEAQYQSGYYRNSSIWLGPYQSDGGRPDHCPDIPVAQAIPAVMLEAVGTEYVEVGTDPEGFDEGLPIMILEAIDALHGSA